MADQAQGEVLGGGEHDPVATAAVVWAFAGVIASILLPVVHLLQKGMRTVQGGLGPGEWVGLLVVGSAFVYGEGVVALQRRWVPWVAIRAAELRRERRLLLRVLAPLYAMGLVGAPARTLGRAWRGVSAIVLAVMFVRALPHPWRGIVDLSVGCALAWGLAAIVVKARAALRGVEGKWSGEVA